MNTMRIIDANINRAAEGIRVLEDYFRFVKNKKKVVNSLRTIRHHIRKIAPRQMLYHRDSQQDVGLVISKQNKLDDKKTVYNLLTANFTRAQEALRVLEEYYKIIDCYSQAKEMELCRFKMYSLQKENLKPLISGLYGITFESDQLNIAKQVEDYLVSGIKIIQYRSKILPPHIKLRQALAIRKLTLQYDALFIVNDDLTLALAAHADGLHLGQEDLDITYVKKDAPHLTVGLSTHNKTQFEQAVLKGADYIAIGPIYQTSSKKNTSPAVGIEFAKWARAYTPLPIVAIGGINSENIQPIIDLGIDSCAVISALINEDERNKLCTQLKWMQQKKV